MKRKTLTTVQKIQPIIEIIWGFWVGYLIIVDSKLMTRSLYVVIGFYFVAMGIGGIVKLVLDWHIKRLNKEIESLKKEEIELLKNRSKPSNQSKSEQ